MHKIREKGKVSKGTGKARDEAGKGLGERTGAWKGTGMTET